MAKTSKNKRTIASAKLSLKKMASDVKEPLAIVAGMVIGKFASDILDKGFAKAQTVSGINGLNGTVSSIAKPVLLIGGGLAAKQMLKNPILKNIGIGVAAYGGATGVTEILNLPVLSNIIGSTPALPPAGGTTSGIRGMLGNLKNVAYNYRNEIMPSVPARQLRPEMMPDLNNAQVL